MPTKPEGNLEEEALPYTTIGTDEAKSMIAAGAHVIDVRQPGQGPPPEGGGLEQG